jgi:CHASE2 domain-containing sensor protein
MSQAIQVLLKLGQGNWQSGFPTVMVQVVQVQVGPTEADRLNPALALQLSGSLPAAPELARLYGDWRSVYQGLSQRLDLRRGFRAIEIEPEGLTQISPAALERLSVQLKRALDRWLESESFRPLDRRLRTQLAPSDEIRLIVETADPVLRRFPWHLWQFFSDYPLAEVAVSALDYGRSSRPRRVGQQVRILAVLGNSQGIDVQQDRAMLAQLPDAEPVFLVEPSRAELDQQLWDERGWDMLFFSGHSASQPDGSTGEIAINAQEQLNLGQLKHALTAAIGRGLQFAIFNSCDGLGLARDMADLNIPQLVVMREPVPDLVAQTFLRHLLTAFAGGASFYCAVRQARAKLQGLESRFPGAAELPLICQNPTELPLSWQALRGAVAPTAENPESSPSRTQSDLPDHSLNSPQSRHSPFSKSLTKTRLAQFAGLTSLAVTGLLLGLRSVGILQALELRAFDQVMRARPAEVADPRILVVEVTQADTNQYGYPLEDKTLAEAIRILNQMQPRAIGVDMHRYQPRGAGRTALLQQFQQPHVFTVCWFATTDKNFAPPPEFSEAQRVQQVGFSDLALDGAASTQGSNTQNSGTLDYTGEPVRRQILSYDPKVASSPPDCPTPYSFSFQLAFRYLYQTGLQPLTVNPAGNWQFGQAVFPRLPARFVGYQDLDGLSSQVMLNYRQGLPGQRVTLNQVLQGQVSRSFVEGRIVLLGTTAPIARDSFVTPYGEQAGIWIHAHQVSQILSAALNQRPLIWGLPQAGNVQWGDGLWVWIWAGLGAGLGWVCRGWRWLLLANGIALFLLYQICLLTLTQAGWLPLVPPAIGLVAASAVVQSRRAKQ